MSMSTRVGAPIVYERSFAVAAPPERVFRALTDAAELRAWFAEHARVEPREGGTFAFWGRFTPWCSNEREADQRITRLEPGRVLAFAWTWRGTRTEASLELAPGAGSTAPTTLTIRHESLGTLVPERPEDTRWVMTDFWRLSVGNLREHLKAGKPAIRPDFAAPGPGLRLSITINQPAERIFAALTQPSLMDQWISKGARVEPRQGGAYDYNWTPEYTGQQGHCGPTRIVEIIPGRRLVTDWLHQDEKPTRVCWEIEPSADGRSCTVTITHDVVGEEPTHGGYVGGWGSFLVELKEFGERGFTPQREK